MLLTCLTLSASLLAAGPGNAAPPDHGDPASVAAIRKVVEAFRTAILSKDKPTYLALFFSDQPERVGWQAVVDDALLARIRTTKPDAIKARHRPENNFLALIDSVVASPKTEEEEILDLTVDTDGEIATAAFNYRYLSAGALENFGREQWQLVRTEQGWKIFSVTYTIRVPAPK